MSVRRWLNEYKTRLHAASLQQDAPGAMARAVWHFILFDHAALRSIWTNFSKVAPGIYRANHPNRRRFETYARMGIRTILNLRGASTLPHYRFEEAACADLGLRLVNLQNLSARTAPDASVLQDAIAVLRTAEKPLLMHCKSGADRSGLIAAIYVLAIGNGTIAQARRQLSLRFIHLKWSKTGILDHIIDSYDAAYQASGISFENWLATSYNPARLQAEFDASRNQGGQPPPPAPTVQAHAASRCAQTG